MDKTVCLINSHNSGLFNTFSKRKGYRITNDIANATIVVFSGYGDINPALYNSTRHPKTMFDADRDKEEKRALSYLPLRQFKLGLNRGAHLLNADNGGSLYQDVDNHQSPHAIYDLAFRNKYDKPIVVSSNHHQVMIPTNQAEVLAFSTARGSYYQKDEDKDLSIPDADVEAVYYPNSNSLCFQPDIGNASTATGQNSISYMFDLVEKILGD